MSKTGIQWCTGVPTVYNEKGVPHVSYKMIPLYPRWLIKNGYMDGRLGYVIQQESTFWTKELWDKCGSVVGNYKLAGDFHLWKAFAHYEPMITLNSVISGFRTHKGQQTSPELRRIAGGWGPLF